jgi:septal ring factor EnvC (AmiA/AmiB activator)
VGVTALLVVAACVALAAVLALHLPAGSRRQRVKREIAYLEEHLADLREEQGETCARLGELRVELAALDAEQRRGAP